MVAKKKSTARKTSKFNPKKKSTARKPSRVKSKRTKKKAVKKPIVKKKTTKRKGPPKGTTRANRITSSKFGIYVTEQKSGKTIHLPVNPSDLSISRESDNTSQKVVGLGEVNQLGERKLTSLEVQSFLPKRKAVYTQGVFHTPQYYIDILNKWQEGKNKVRVTVTSTKITFLMTISTFKHGYEKGYADDVIYTLTFTQYVPFSYSKIRQRKKPSGKSVRKRSKKKRFSKAKKMTRGSSVVVTGTAYRKSTGGVVAKKLKKAKRKITLVSAGKKYPYHIREGWVAKNSVKRA